jgi:trk system potassium uptake protein TrkA
MNVLVLGAGRVGSEIARLLVGNACDVTVVDTNPSKLLTLQSNYDLRTVNGSAADPELLGQVGITDIDMVIAVTAGDEVNLVACKICKLLSDGLTTIARVRNNRLSAPEITGKEGFGIDHIFCPEQIIAESFCNAIMHPGCQSVNRFADGLVVLACIRVSPQTDEAGSTIRELRQRVKEVDYRIVSVFRDNEPIKPVAETRLFVGDDVYVLVANDALNTLIPYLAGQATENRRILIGGGGNIGQRVAVALEKNHDIKIIETSRDRCRDLSQILDNTLILKGTASDEKLLSEEGVAETDIFCALTNDDEENILSAMLARELGCKQTAVLINRAAYVDILERNLGIVLSPSQITIGSVLTHVRTGDISAVHSLRQGSAEAIEAVIHGDDDTSPVVGREIQGIEWPDNAMPGAIVRDGEVLIAHDDTVIMSDDRLICFISDRKAVREVERLLQVSVNYF